MKLFKLGTLLTLLMLTGVLDYLISAIPVIASAWLLASGLLGLTGLAQRLERERERRLRLATVYLPR
ncbi:MAG TPA: hypothetical protein VGA79_06190 [Desulfobaccales bacterium]|jgi:hypothetical protein